MSIRDFAAKLQLEHKKRKMEFATFDFPAALQSPKQILVCLPGELRELTILKQFLPAITDLFKPATIHLLTMPGLKITDIFPRKGFNILAPTADQQSWTGLAKKSFLDKLTELNIDLVLDLNLGTSWFTSSVLLAFPNALRIGRGNHLAQPFYNLEIKTRYLRDERNIYRSIIETLKLLKEGRNEEDVRHHRQF